MLCSSPAPVPGPRDLFSSSPAARTDLLTLLPLDERCQYESLVGAICTEVQAAHKHPGVTSFVKHMSLVHGFIARGNIRDPLRGVVCGVEFGRGFLLVNTGRLKKVLFRSKSCMNVCFQRLGYDVMRPSPDIVALFSRLIPNVNPELFAIRQWCVRLARDGSLLFAANGMDSLAGKVEAAPVFTIPFDCGPREDFNFLDIRSLLNPHPIEYP
jgi:hypothetical protein